METFKRKVYENIENNNMLEAVNEIVLGVSGGADSVCLFRVLLDYVKEKNKDISLKVVHINHMIRETATADEAFVRSLCDKYNVPFVVVRADVPAMAKENHQSVEEAGRAARYEAFYQEMYNKEKAIVAVAHNLNDNSETILFNMFRGSGLKGMCGIAPVSYKGMKETGKDENRKMKVVRPLIVCTREEIEEYLSLIGQDYVTDETNLSDEYTRNIIRNDILKTACVRINEKAIKNVSVAGDFVSKAFYYIEKNVLAAYEELVTEDNGRISMSIEELSQRENIIIDGVIKKALVKVAGAQKDLTKGHIDSIIGLMSMEGNHKVNLPYEVVAEKLYGNIVIFKGVEDVFLEKNESVIDRAALEDSGEYRVDFRNSIFAFRIIDKNNCSESDKKLIKKLINEKNNYTKCFDYGKILGSLVLRNRRDGDYMMISPKGGRKKLKSFFIDNKIEPDKRMQIPLLTCDNEVLWVVGMRTGCSAYVDETTSKVLMVTITMSL